MMALDGIDLRLLALLGLGALVPLGAVFFLRLEPVIAGVLSAVSVLLIVGMVWLLFGPAEATHTDEHGGA